MAKKISTAYDFLNGITVATPGGKLNADAPTTYPLGLSSSAVIAANGWPFDGVVLTVAMQSGSTYTMQLVGSRFGGSLYKRASSDGATWGPWVSAVMVDQIQTLVNKTLTSPVLTGTTTAEKLVLTPVTLTDAATIATNAALGNTFRCTLTASRILGAPTNPTDGQSAVWELKASGGAWTPTLASGAGGFAFGSDITAITAIVSGKTDIIGARYRATENRWWVVGYTKGFA